MRAVGSFLKDRGVTVTAFYVSNVEDYLQRNGVWPKFCANVAALPMDSESVFIRLNGGRSALFAQWPLRPRAAPGSSVTIALARA